VTKQVALADATYARLRAAKHPGESFSEAIERLLRSNNDPRGFATSARPARSAKERIAELERERDETITDA